MTAVLCLTCRQPGRPNTTVGGWRHDAPDLMVTLEDVVAGRAPNEPAAIPAHRFRPDLAVQVGTERT